MDETTIVEETTEERPPADPPGEPVSDPEWLDTENGIEELMKDESSANILKQYEGRSAALKALVDTKKSLSSGFKMPEELSEDQLNEVSGRVNTARGVPEKAEDYELTRPEEVDESLEVSDFVKSELKTFGKEVNLGKQSLQTLYERIHQWLARASTEAARSQKEVFEKQAAETAESMKTYWGPNEYARVAKLMDAYVKTTSLDDKEYDNFEKLLDKTGLRHHPMMWRLLGDAARRWEILEGNATGQSDFQTRQGKERLSDTQRRQKMYPNTPASLGGGRRDK
jgi:hypothetical protein